MRGDVDGADPRCDVIIVVNGYFAAPQAHYNYSYDGDGLRRTKNWYGIAATYRYSLAEGLPMPIEENVFGGLLRSSYIYGPGGLPIEQVTELNGTVTSKVWFHHDQLGFTRMLTDENGNWRTKYAYDPYGNTAATETNPAYPTITTNLQYTGQFTDNETGYQYLRARYYDPTTARFLTRDPANALTRSAYGYVGGSPLNRTDPAGLAPWDWVAEQVDKVVPDDLSAVGNVVRPVLNTTDGVNLAGLVWGLGTGGDCSLRGPHIECTDVKWLPRDAMTIGDVVLEDSETPISESDPVLFGHETNHSNQWAFWGWAFVPTYFADLAVHHGSDCGGWFEQAANGPAGGYDDCTCGN